LFFFSSFAFDSHVATVPLIPARSKGNRVERPSIAEQLLDPFHDEHILRGMHDVFLDHARCAHFFDFLIASDMSADADPWNVVEIVDNLPLFIDRLDLFSESGQLPGEVGILLRYADEVHQLFTDQVAEGFLDSELRADGLGGFALRDPDLVEIGHGWSFAPINGLRLI
jgi:hypothetical protein